MNISKVLINRGSIQRCACAECLLLFLLILLFFLLIQASYFASEMGDIVSTNRGTRTTASRDDVYLLVSYAAFYAQYFLSHLFLHWFVRSKHFIASDKQFDRVRFANSEPKLSSPRLRAKSSRSLIMNLYFAILLARTRFSCVGWVQTRVDSKAGTGFMPSALMCVSGCS